MSSIHPDFVGLDVASLSDADALEYLKAHPAPPTRLLNGEILEIDSARGTSRYRFKIMPDFCHSQGKICQGGFLTGMVDVAMAYAAMARGRFAVAVPTLEIKVSFLEAVGPGQVFAEARVLRWGGSVGFLDGEIRDETGRLVLHATSTIKIVRPRT